MKKMKIPALMLIVSMIVGLGGCGSDTEESEGASNYTSTDEMLSTDVVTDDESQGYSYGLDETFYSDEPVTYSMMFSDHENYPYQEDWRIFSAIKEMTNVDFDLTLIARADYDDKKSVLINTGGAPYIIPKTYDESPFVDSGQVVAISDWVKYMPNYQEQVEKWGMQTDLKQKLQANGKYYVLPGMWESAGGGYSYIIRKDIFEAAGVDVDELEKTWTYDDFYEALKKVKAYMGDDKYVLSDRFTGSSMLNIMAKVYGVTAGWGLSTGTLFDEDSESFYFADTTDEFKDMVTLLHQMVEDELIDPESFSQEDETALSKFYRGETAVISGQYQNLADMEEKMQVDGDLYLVTQPGGPEGLLQIENSRLENGIMISQNALDDLGEEDFIKMLRFIDWLWYSDEGHMLSLWGVEGETYTLDDDGNVVLDPDISYNGINTDTATKQLNVDYGFGGGVFAYGGSDEIRESKMTDEEKDYNQRIQETRELTPVDPPIMADEEETEEMNLIKTPLMDYVNTMTLKFITGQEDIDSGWDAYVAQCQSLGSDRYVQEANDIFENTKDILGY